METFSNKIKKIDQNDHNTIYKWVKTDEFLRGNPPSSPIFLKSSPPHKYFWDYLQWRWKLANFDGDGDKNFGVKGGYPQPRGWNKKKIPRVLWTHAFDILRVLTNFQESLLFLLVQLLMNSRRLFNSYGSRRPRSLGKLRVHGNFHGYGIWHEGLPYFTCWLSLENSSVFGPFVYRVIFILFFIFLSFFLFFSSIFLPPWNFRGVAFLP